MKLALLVFILLCASANPQQTNQATAVFILTTDMPMFVHGPVFVDGVEVASLKVNHYLKMEIPAGEHTFASKRKEEGADCILEAGKTYHFRIRPGQGVMILEPVPTEVGVYDSEHLSEQQNNK